MNQQDDLVWVIFTDRKAPNNRKQKVRKWAENEDLQKTYNFYIEQDISKFADSLKEKPEVKTEVKKEVSKKQNPIPQS